MKKTNIKFETLRKGFNFKKAFYVLLIIVIIGSVVIVKGSKANYTYQEIIPFAEGEVHIKKYDFKIMAMYEQTEKNKDNYKEITTMPEGDYVINTTKSGCYKDSNKETKNNNAKLYTNAAGEHVMSKLDKEDKCYLYFDIKLTAKEKILADHTTINKRQSGTFGSVVTESTTGTIYESADESQYDDFGKVYYFAGNPGDNWVKFGQIKVIATQYGGE